MRQRNERLRQARLALRAPDGSASPMSRQELAEAVNAQVAAATGRPGVMSGGHVGKLEQGRYCWPRRHYREAFRIVLGVERDSDLGFRIIRRAPRREGRQTVAAGEESPPPPGEDDGNRPPDAAGPVVLPARSGAVPARVRIARGRSILITCADGEVAAPPDAGQPARMVIVPGISVLVASL